MNDPDREETIFASLLALPPSARGAYLDEACACDAELRGRVEELLRLHEGAGAFMETPVAPDPGETVQLNAPLSEKPGDKIGRYKLLEQIGEGGCGVVYMAEQEEPVRRRVALKIIKLGMDTRDVVTRFEAERQALALMDHPNIARVFDGGATDSGRPFFVMELVRGTPITTYCDEHRLTTRERLELFMQVCQAVQHAHQKGIIHRDLKPSNILVTELDGRPTPKVIDFGVAKATEQRLTEKTLFTRFGQIIGTPAYMSPEQAGFGGLDIDTRSDVYSLGVLLYELLTGRPPFDSKKLLEAGYEAILKTIREVEPPKPSTKLSTLSREELVAIASQRNAEAAKLNTLMRGELDWIVVKAMEKDRARRYETANDIAADIQRHLNNEPIVARPPSKLYEFQKTVRRHKFGFAATAAVILVLAGGVVVSTHEATRAIRAEREQSRLREAAELAQLNEAEHRRLADEARESAEANERKAETEAARSVQVVQFLQDLLKTAGPDVSRGRNLAVLRRETLDKASERVGHEFKGQPSVQGDLWFTLARTYSEMGDYPEAITNYQRAAESYRAAFGDENAKLALTLGFLGLCHTAKRDFEAGKSIAKLGLDMARKCAGTNVQILATCLLNMGKASSAPGMISTKEGAPYLHEAMALWKDLGNNPTALADCLHSLATVHAGDRLDEDISFVRQALALHQQHLETDHPKIAGGEFLLGQLLLEAGKPEEANLRLQTAFDLYRKIHDMNHPYQTVIPRFRTEALARLRRWREAENFVQSELELWQPKNAQFWSMMIRLKTCQEDWTSALELSVRALELHPGENTLSSARMTLLLYRGFNDEYRELRHSALNRSRDIRVAMAGLLLPVTDEDSQRACAVVDAASAADRRKEREPGVELAVALAEYRRGSFNLARDFASRVIDPECDCIPDWSDAQSWFIQAMAHSRLQQTEAAQAAFARGEALVNEPHVDFVNAYGGGWGQWIAAELLRREAKELISTTAAGPGQE